MNKEYRDSKFAQMEKSLHIAKDVWNFISDRIDETPDDVGITSAAATEIMEVIARRFKAPLPRLRQNAIGSAMEHVMNEHGLSSCGLWEFAHLLEHILYEEDLSTIIEAMA